MKSVKESLKNFIFLGDLYLKIYRASQNNVHVDHTYQYLTYLEAKTEK
jgi:hypothetical protein